MHIHILGICGTFMGSLALLAKNAGHRVTGCDKNVYPPMSTQLEQAGIELIEGFDAGQVDLQADIFVIGNVVSRGNPLMEAILERGCRYTSGPQWLAQTLLQDKWVLGVSGTHGKTSTASMLAWVLEYAHMSPGFLIGGVAANFGISARLGESDFFVIEADEYDTAFFDKRSKFVHYQPRTLIINNLEFDHADIFAGLAAIQTQFHHLLRTVPGSGLVISPQAEPAIDELLARGCWTPRQTTAINQAADWRADICSDDGSRFEIAFQQQRVGEVQWPLTGRHNVQNALSTLAAARHVGVPAELACEALSEFKGVKRRMEKRGQVGAVTVYDDFAHHPTAIASTLEGLRARVGSDQLWAVIEPRSNTMKLGIHKDSLAACTRAADFSFWFQPDSLAWQLNAFIGDRAAVFENTEMLVAQVAERAAGNGAEPLHLVVMSNGGFEGIHQRLLDALAKVKT